MTERSGEYDNTLFGADEFDFSSFLCQPDESQTDVADIQTANPVTEFDTHPQSANFLPPPAVSFDLSALNLHDYNHLQELDLDLPSLADPYWDSIVPSELLPVPDAEDLSQLLDRAPVNYPNPIPNNFLDIELPPIDILKSQSGYSQPPANTISYYEVANIPPIDRLGASLSGYEVPSIFPQEKSTRGASRQRVVAPPPHRQPAANPNKIGPSPLPHQYSQENSDSENSMSSPELTPSKPTDLGTLKKYYDEKPEASSEHPWGRINASTKGLTSRTGKINHFKPEEVYQNIPHPLDGEWSTRGGKKFEYNRWGELQRPSFGFHMLKEFILQHPKTKDCKLTLYIQRSPADSMRRYPTKNGSECRFTECPMREYGLHGKITHGHYRVALDELSYKYGTKELNDPMVVPGYVHLYCLERFMDLPALCQLPHIRVIADSRSLSKEPNGKFHAALSGNDYKVASNFIETCKRDALREHPDFKDYPEHEEYRDAGNVRQVGPKHHNTTLNYMLQRSRNAERSLKVRSEFKASNIAVHLGDLEIYCKARKGIITSLVDVPTQAEQVSKPAKSSKTPKRAATKTKTAFAPLIDYSTSSSDVDDDSDDDSKGDSEDETFFLHPSAPRKRGRGESHGNRSGSGSSKRRKL
jgi:hypothetical protein